MSDKWIKILCGKLYTGLEARFLEHAEILVHGQYIEEVGSNLPCPEGTEILDLSHLTVTPGMIDAPYAPGIFQLARCLQRYHLQLRRLPHTRHLLHRRTCPARRFHNYPLNGMVPGIL